METVRVETLALEGVAQLRPAISVPLPILTGQVSSTPSLDGARHVIDLIRPGEPTVRPEVVEQTQQIARVIQVARPERIAPHGVSLLSRRVLSEAMPPRYGIEATRGVRDLGMETGKPVEIKAEGRQDRPRVEPRDLDLHRIERLATHIPLGVQEGRAPATVWPEPRLQCDQELD